MLTKISTRCPPHVRKSVVQSALSTHCSHSDLGSIDLFPAASRRRRLSRRGFVRTVLDRFLSLFLFPSLARPLDAAGAKWPLAQDMPNKLPAGSPDETGESERDKKEEEEEEKERVHRSFGLLLDSEAAKEDERVKNVSLGYKLPRWPVLVT